MPTTSLSNLLFDQTFASNSDDKIPYCHVPKTQNYVSPDKSMFVVNNDSDDLSEFGFSTSLRSPIDKLTDVVVSMFETGLEHYFKFDNKKRNLDDTPTTCHKTTNNKLSGTMGLRKKKSAKKSSKKRKINHHSIKAVDDWGKSVTQKVKNRSLPIISFGYTQSDCQVYGSNISTVAGTVKPSKMDGNLPKKLRQKIIDLVEIVLEYIPDECTFDIFLDK